MAAPTEDSSRRPDTTDEAIVYDNFYSPENRLFYAKKPYKPLSPLDHEIRLLKLLPSGDDGILSFTLLDNVPLASVDNRFTALSYCAGNPRNTSRVIVNGLEFNVFANLGHAIREILTYWKKGDVVLEQQLLWIDQICIDQSNPQERSHQVEMMKNIYAGAEKVLICLSEKECSAFGLQFAIGLRKTLRIGLPAGDACRGMKWKGDKSKHAVCITAMESYYQSYEISGRSTEVVADFRRLVKSSWWKRCWICQEFIVARDAEFLYGGHFMNWMDFAQVVFHMMDIPSLAARLCAKDLDSMDSMFILYWLLIKKRNMKELRETCSGELTAWLNYGRDCESSDARDKIFAFLGLASEEYNITPDYSPLTSLEALLIQVSTRIVAVDKNLDLLLCSGREKNRPSRFNMLPTWVPDWRQIPYYVDALYPKKISLTPPRVENSTKLMAEGFWLNNPESSLIMAFTAAENKEQDPWIRFQKAWMLDEDDGLWYFPYTSALFKLKKVNSHWLLIEDVSKTWQPPREQIWDSSQPNPCSNLLNVALRGDVAWLLKQGLKREVIEIR